MVKWCWWACRGWRGRRVAGTVINGPAKQRQRHRHRQRLTGIGTGSSSRLPCEGDTARLQRHCTHTCIFSPRQVALVCVCAEIILTNALTRSYFHISPVDRRIVHYYYLLCTSIPRIFTFSFILFIKYKYKINTARADVDI